MSSRTFWRTRLAPDSCVPMSPPIRASQDEANLLASLTDDGDHMPAIDFDIPVRLVSSSTPGHSHLYIDKAIPWGSYVALLSALRVADLIEEGFYLSAIVNGATHLRTHKKGERES